MTRLRLLTCLAVLGGLTAAPVSSALGITSFRTPSKNIYCGFIGNQVRCDIFKTSAKGPPEPPSCQLDWGIAYGLTQRGRGRGLCVGDTVLNSRAKVLAYGTSIKRGRITCTSRTAGLTCANKNGHGFFLSRQRIRVY
ncbi:MAG: DUF6636 domain-containing protein [Thermoleophilia bacterium]